MRTNVYLTVDTEHSMGGAWDNAALRPVPAERHIYCHIGGKDNGIGWICDELERHKFRATFFAEVFCSLVFGVDATRSWCQYLLQHGQDVQLHTHLNYYYYAKKQGSPVAASEPTDRYCKAASTSSDRIVGTGLQDILLPHRICSGCIPGWELGGKPGVPIRFGESRHPLGLQLQSGCCRFLPR